MFSLKYISLKEIYMSSLSFSTYRTSNTLQKFSSLTLNLSGIKFFMNILYLGKVEILFLFFVRGENLHLTCCVAFTSHKK
jgi:hypothetical protein